MAGRGILDADMATVAGWLRQGLNWWRDELADLVPARLRQPARRRMPLAIFGAGPNIGAKSIDFADPVPVKTRSGAATRADLALPLSRALVRELRIPSMREADMRSYLALEAERLFPIARDNLLIDAERLDRADAQRQMTIRIAAVERAVALTAVQGAREADLIPDRIGIVSDETPAEMRFDFAPQLRAEGLLPPVGRQRPIWWGVVAFLFLANIGLLVWRDGQSVAMLEQLVDSQRPAVTVYRKIAERTARVDQIERTTAQRRMQQDALADLGAASAGLPDAAWVQRYSWDGRSLRLAGYLRPPADVIAALGQNDRFINVRPASSDVQADNLSG